MTSLYPFHQPISQATCCLVCQQPWERYLPQEDCHIPSESTFLAYHASCKPLVKGKKPIVICVEGLDGVGKTTQIDRLCEKLEKEGVRTLRSKEPGSKQPLVLYAYPWRGWMLDTHYKKNRALLCQKIRAFLDEDKGQLNGVAKGFLEIVLKTLPPTDNRLLKTDREYISQAIRAVHNHQLLYPHFTSGEYDVMVLDRGIYSGLAYAHACDVNPTLVHQLVCEATSISSWNALFHFYDLILYLKGDIEMDLAKAVTATQDAKELEEGDDIEDQGVAFQQKVEKGFDHYAYLFEHRMHIVDTKDRTDPTSLKELPREKVEGLIWTHVDAHLSKHKKN